MWIKDVFYMLKKTSNVPAVVVRFKICCLILGYSVISWYMFKISTDRYSL